MVIKKHWNGFIIVLQRDYTVHGTALWCWVVQLSKWLTLSSKRSYTTSDVAFKSACGAVVIARDLLIKGWRNDGCAFVERGKVK